WHRPPQNSRDGSWASKCRHGSSSHRCPSGHGRSPAPAPRSRRYRVPRSPRDGANSYRPAIFSITFCFPYWFLFFSKRYYFEYLFYSIGVAHFLMDLFKGPGLDQLFEPDEVLYIFLQGFHHIVLILFKDGGPHVRGALGKADRALESTAGHVKDVQFVPFLIDHRFPQHKGADVRQMGNIGDMAVMGRGVHISDAHPKPLE